MLVLAVLLAAAVLRFAFISADLPVFFSPAQDDVYDAAWYVQDAQYIVQGRAPHFEEGKLKVIWTAYFTVVFWLLGPGFWQGNVGVASLGVVLVWLVFLVVRRAAGWTTAFVAMLLAGTNFILAMYSRTPLPYIGLCTALMLCFYLWFVLQKHPWFLFIPYILAVVFVFHLKSLSLFILPVMAVTDLLMLLGRGKKEFFERAKPYLVAICAAVVFAVLEYQWSHGVARRYFESRYAAYVGDTSFMEYVRGLLSMGFESPYFIQMPFAAFLAFLYPILLARGWWQGRSLYKSESVSGRISRGSCQDGGKDVAAWPRRGELRLGIACMFWMFGAIGSFAFLKYRSQHYFIVMSPAVIIMAALSIRRLASLRRIFWQRGNILAAALFFLFVIYLSYQLIAQVMIQVASSGRVGDFVARSVGKNVHSHAMTLTVFGASWALPLATVVALLVFGAWRLVRCRLPREGIVLPEGFARRGVGVVVGLSVILNLGFFVRFTFERGYSTMHVPGEILAMVGENAKLGEHGCALAGYGNRLVIERRLFNFRTGVISSRNITHLVLNIYRALLIRHSPLQEGKYAKPVGVLTVKRVPTILYRLKNLPANYRMSKYENGVMLLRDGKPALALQEFQEASRIHPRSGILKRYAGIAVYEMGRSGDAIEYFREALTLLPEDYLANIYLVACLTAHDRFDEAIAKLEWMKRYYVYDLQAARTAFSYRRCLERSRAPGQVRKAELLKLVESVIWR